MPPSPLLFLSFDSCSPDRCLSHSHMPWTKVSVHNFHASIARIKRLKCAPGFCLYDQSARCACNYVAQSICLNVYGRPIVVVNECNLCQSAPDYALTSSSAAQMLRDDHQPTGTSRCIDLKYCRLR